MRSMSISSCKPILSQLAATVLLTVLASVASPVFAQLAITCPADITVSNDPGDCSAIVAYSAPVVTGATLPITVTTVPDSGTAFPVGTNEVVCTVTDANTNTTCTFTITVVDAEAPTITNVRLSKSLLWPPNHKLVPVTVNYDLSDNCDGEPTATLSVESDESVDGIGDGNFSPDWEVLDAHRVLLRAERAGPGNGRIYTITITGTDASGNTSSKAVAVLVPHSKGKKGQGSQGNGNGNGHGHGHGK